MVWGSRQATLQERCACAGRMEKQGHKCLPLYQLLSLGQCCGEREEMVSQVASCGGKAKVQLQVRLYRAPTPAPPALRDLRAGK